MAKDRGRNQNTARADETGFRWFARACEAFGGTNPVRPTPEEADPEEEAFLSSWVLLFTAMHQKPRSTTTASGVRKDRANPNSSAAMLRGAHRSLAEYGSYVPPMKAVAPVLKGMRTAMIDDFGDDAMAAEQAAAFPQHMLDAMRTNLEICAVPGLSDEECGVAGDMLVAGINLGLRKAEYPRYKRSNIQWRDGNKRPLEPTPENIAKAHWMEVTPVCSKTDPHNKQWGATRMWFRVNDADPWSLASRLRRRELNNPCRPSERHCMPLFADLAGALNTSFSSHRMTSIMSAMVATATAPDKRRFFRWHSCRRTMACKLRKAKKPWDRIQTLLRWKSPDSVHIYGALDAEDYAQDVEDGLRADATGVRSDTLPPLDPNFGAVDSVIEEISASLRSPASERRTPPAEPLLSQSKKQEATQPPAVLEYDLGGVVVSGIESDSWGLVGTKLRVPLSAWPDTANLAGTESCVVVALAVSAPHEGNYLLRALDDEIYAFSLRDVRKLIPSARAAALRRSGQWRRKPEPDGAVGA